MTSDTAQPTPRVHRSHGYRLARILVGLVVALLAGAGLTACSSTGPETGDCVEKSDDSYTVADCATASLRVLERIDDTGGDCVPVAGVTESYADYGNSRVLCLGPRDVDPATAINAAQQGDCVAGAEASADVRRVDCGDPAAESVILQRIEDATAIGMVGNDACSDAPGTNSSYSWDLVTTSSSEDSIAGIGDGLAYDLLFCLGPAGVDPATSPDLAQAGDCLRETAEDPGYAKVDCADPAAEHRVVERVDSAFIPLDVACSSADGATSGIQRGSGGLDGYILCLGAP